jgi:uncharacterized protein (TIGR02001 family)
MIKLRFAAAAATLAVSGAAAAGNVSATVGLVSDYDFRGLTQTLNDPAFQLGLTYTGDSGMYYGLWGSNVDFQGGGATLADSDIDKPSTEVDIFMGFSGEKYVGYDIGVIYYSYPNAGTWNYPEAYVGVTKGPLNLKVWYSWDWANTGDPSFYTEGNVNVPMGDNFKFLGHVGYSDTSAWSSIGNYYDWSAGFGYSASNFDLTFKYVDGNDLKVPAGVPKHLGRFVFGASTTLPWK